MITKLPGKSNSGLQAGAGMPATVYEILIDMCQKLSDYAAETPWNGKNCFFRTVIASGLTSLEPLTIQVSRTWDRETRKRITQLPDELIPYTPHARPFIYLVLLCYKSRESLGLTVNQICEMADIVPSTLYRWRDRYLQDFYEWFIQHLALMAENRTICCHPPCQTSEIFRQILVLYHIVVEKIQLFFSFKPAL